MNMGEIAVTPRTLNRAIVWGGTICISVVAVAGCATQETSVSGSQAGTSGASAASPDAKPAPEVIHAVGAENEYANVIAQIGGKYVQVTGIMSNPNTDPHTFEASPKVAEVIAGAQLVVQNGVGYDDFMTKLEAASAKAGQRVVDVQNLLGLPDSTENPHLWYKPTTMPAVAEAIASDLSNLMPGESAYFHASATRFRASLAPWLQAIATVRAQYPNAPVATTEPVADYMLQACGMDNLTPWAFQADIMNGTDPSPQDVTIEENLLRQHKVKVFLYNQQVVDPLTTSLLQLARQNSIAVVGVYETMPFHHTYQSWMLDEVHDLQNALKNHISTETIA